MSFGKGFPETTRNDARARHLPSPTPLVTRYSLLVTRYSHSSLSYYYLAAKFGLSVSQNKLEVPPAVLVQKTHIFEDCGGFKVPLLPVPLEFPPPTTSPGSAKADKLSSLMLPCTAVHANDWSGNSLIQ